MPESAHVLVVANRTAASPELLEALEQRASEGPVRFTLLVPATPHGLDWAGDMRSGGDEAEANMRAAVELLREAGLIGSGTDAEAYMRVSALRYLLLRTHAWDDAVIERLREELDRPAAADEDTLVHQLRTELAPPRRRP